MVPDPGLSYGCVPHVRMIGCDVKWEHVCMAVDGLAVIPDRASSAVHTHTSPQPSGHTD